MYTAEKFFQSVPWFLLGVVLNRIKFILLSIIIIQLGQASLMVFYISLHLVNEFIFLATRIVSACYNRFLREKEIVENKNKLNSLLNSYLQLGFLFGVACLIIVFFLSTPLANLLKEKTFIPSLRLFSFSIPFLIISNQIFNILSVLGKYKQVVIFHNIFEAMFLITAVYLSIFFFKTNLSDAILVFWASVVILSILALYLLFKIVPSFRPVLKFLPLRPPLNSLILQHAFSMKILGMIDILILAYFYGSGSVGTYIALLIAPLLVYATATSVFSMFIHSAVHYFYDRRKLTFVADKIFLYVLFLTIPLMLLIFLYPDQAIHRLLRVNHFIDSAIVRILSLSFFIKLLGWISGQILVSLKKSEDNIKTNVFLAIFSIPLFLFFIPKYGLLGASLALLILSSLEAFIKTFLVYQREKIYFISYSSISALVLGFTFLMIYLFFIQLKFSLFLLSFPVPYIFFLFLLGSIHKTDLTILLNMDSEDLLQWRLKRIIFKKSKIKS